MKKLIAVLLVVWGFALPGFAQNICLDSSGNTTAPNCTDDREIQVEAGGKSKCVDITPTIETNAYAAGDLMAAVMTLNVADAEGKGFFIQSVTLGDEGAESAQVKLVIFDADPDSLDAWTINGAFDPGDAYIDDVCCRVTISSFDSWNDNGNGYATAIGCHCIPDASTNLYGALVAAESVTYDATDALTVKICGFQD